MSDDHRTRFRRTYRDAVLALPVTTRAIFLQHRVDGDDLATIAARHALPADDVASHIADALIAIDRALRAAGV
ncbi:MAG: hypothetical protein JWR80_6692 [Bradyrhizobium sp.]|nr:hypothetical protein [Bradyrhizobium sp.]